MMLLENGVIPPNLLFREPNHSTPQLLQELASPERGDRVGGKPEGCKKSERE